MTEQEIYEALSLHIADTKYNDHDYLEMDYDDESKEWVLWYNGTVDVAHYDTLTGKIY